MRLLLVAAPGGGKGTQGERLAAWSGARHIAAGDLLRADVIRHRLAVFAETTQPLVRYYAGRGILVSVDADQPPESVTSDIEGRLARLPLVHGDA